MMRKFEYKPPRIHSGELRIPVTFYEYTPNPGPEPGESKKNTLYDCMGKIDEVWMKDLERAKTNGTVEDITITIRDPLDDYLPSNKHFINVDARGYKEKVFNVKHAFPDPQHNAFIKIVGGIKS